MGSLAFKVQYKETSCSCLQRALAKLVSRVGTSNHPASLEGQWEEGLRVLRAKRPGFQCLLGQSEWDFGIVGTQSSRW